MRRPAHKLAHATCPYGVGNWSDCDAAAAHRWGRCTVMVESKSEPHTCTNWAVAEDGLCGQHYISTHDKSIRKARDAERQLQLKQSIHAFLELSARPDYDWWSGLATSAQSTRGLEGIGSPPRSEPRVRKGPHRLDALA